MDETKKERNAKTFDEFEGIVLAFVECLIGDMKVLKFDYNKKKFSKDPIENFDTYMEKLEQRLRGARDYILITHNNFFLED